MGGMKERSVIQLGLVGFGKEVPEQLQSNTPPISKIDEQKASEQESRMRIIPKGSVIYQSHQPEIAYTVVEPFYVLKQKNPKQKKKMERVQIASDFATVYRDGQRVEWGRGTIIEVNTTKMITKK
jgi:ribosomal protein S8E